MTVTNVRDEAGSSQTSDLAKTLLSNRDAVTQGKMAYYVADFGDVYPYTLSGYVRARAAAVRAAGLTTLAEFRAFRRGWESWAVEDNARLGWWWL